MAKNLSYFAYTQTAALVDLKRSIPAKPISLKFYGPPSVASDVQRHARGRAMGDEFRTSSLVDELLLFLEQIDLYALVKDFEELESVLQTIKKQLRKLASGHQKAIHLSLLLLDEQHSVKSLTIRLRSDGSSKVAMDGDPEFALPAKLTQLLIAAASGQRDADGLVRRRSLQDMSSQLKTTRQNVNQLVSRLRKRLSRHGWDHLLETTRRRGASPATIRFRTKQLVVLDDSGRVIQRT